MHGVLHPKGSSGWGQRGQGSESSAARSPAGSGHLSGMGEPLLPCAQAWSSLGPGAVLSTPGSPGHFALVVGVQPGCHLGVHPAQAAVELHNVQLLQLLLPVGGRAGG